jgi:hypothetical protein
MSAIEEEEEEEALGMLFMKRDRSECVCSAMLRVIQDCMRCAGYVERRWNRGGVILLDVRHPKHGTPQERCVVKCVNCFDFEVQCS